jgi:hypothetical protein
MADEFGASYGSLPFSEQIAFFRRKLGNQLPTNAWTDVQLQEHDHAFVVAGANRADLLGDFAQAVDKAISQGTTLEEFRKDFDDIVARHGWDYKGGRNWRSRVIYETNMRTSYAAGRYAQLQEVKKARPYWQYVHSDAVMHPRPQHLSWNGLVLSADDPWWHTHFGPNGWGCQCTVKSLAERDLAKLGKAGPDKAPPVNLQTRTIGQRSPGGPREVETPEGIDPGFGYTPGRDAWLREQVSRQLQAAGTPASSAGSSTGSDWEPILGRNAGELPAAIPASPKVAPLAAKPATPQAMLEAARTVLGGDAKVFDVMGLPVAADAQQLASLLEEPAELDQVRFLPWLADVMNDPFEVWMQLERHKATGVYRTSARIIKLYAYRPEGSEGVLVIVDQVDGVLSGWTVLPAGDLGQVADKRRGLLWWSAS